MFDISTLLLFVSACIVLVNNTRAGLIVANQLLLG